MEKNPVRETTRFVVENAKDVKISSEKIKEVADVLIKEVAEPSLWPSGMYLEINSQQEILDYLIILDSLNFCFWSKKKKWHVNYKGKEYSGYYALSVALKKFFEKNPVKANLNYFSKISYKEFKDVLGGAKNLLFLRKRWQIVVAVARTIINKYKNSENFIKSADHKFSNLVKKIYKLHGFNDIFSYKGKKIYLLKRAQILACDIWWAFKGKGLGRFDDLNYLACFPDYKIPQILNNLGILEYSEKLNKKIKNKILIPMGSEEEIEIRSATVQAVEMLKGELSKKGMEIPAFQLDGILWNKSKRDKMSCNHHLTKTIFY